MVAAPNSINRLVPEKKKVRDERAGTESCGVKALAKQQQRMKYRQHDKA